MTFLKKDFSKKKKKKKKCWIWNCDSSVRVDASSPFFPLFLPYTKVHTLPNSLAKKKETESPWLVVLNVHYSDVIKSFHRECCHVGGRWKAHQIEVDDDFVRGCVYVELLGFGQG